MKRSKKLKLALMGVSPILLSGCDSSSSSGTNALIYKNVESCTADGVLNKDSCEYYYHRSWRNHLSQAPRYDNKQHCEADFSTDCQQLSTGEYIPTLEGFMITREGRSSTSYSVWPLYLGYGGGYRSPYYGDIGRIGTQGRVTLPDDKKVKPSLKSNTMKRGGFGSKSAARGSWGG